MQTKPKSQVQLFLEITAISGEYPSENIHRIFTSPSYAKKIISTLTADKLIKKVNAGGLKGYRLAIRGKRKLVSDSPARFAGYLDGDVETNKMRGDHARRLRLHSIAQAYTLMHNANVHVFQDAKPSLLALARNTSQTSIKSDESPENRKPRHPPISAPCFYSSREQKANDGHSNAIRGSRAVGTLLTPTQVYAVYNTGNTHMGLRERIEQRYKADIRESICRKLFQEQYNGKDVHGLMIGRDLQSLEQYWAAGSKGGAELSFLKNTYHPLYYITNDAFGEIQLRLLCNDAKAAALQNALSKGLRWPDAKYPIEHDAFTQDGTPVLFCCLLDIPRFLRFHNGLSLQGVTGKIIAFDFQREVLMRHIGDRAEFVAISFEKFAMRFFPDTLSAK